MSQHQSGEEDETSTNKSSNMTNPDDPIYEVPRGMEILSFLLLVKCDVPKPVWTGRTGGNLNSSPVDGSSLLSASRSAWSLDTKSKSPASTGLKYLRMGWNDSAFHDAKLALHSGTLVDSMQLKAIVRMLKAQYAMGQFDKVLDMA
jgi:hypothetical protein